MSAGIDLRFDSIMLISPPIVGATHFFIQRYSNHDFVINFGCYITVMFLSAALLTLNNNTRQYKRFDGLLTQAFILFSFICMQVLPLQSDENS